MGSPQKHSMRACDVGKGFIENIITNRRQKIGENKPIDKKDLYFWEVLLLLKQFFTKNPKQYLELVKMEYKE